MSGDQGNGVNVAGMCPRFAMHLKNPGQQKCFNHFKADVGAFNNEWRFLVSSTHSPNESQSDKMTARQVELAGLPGDRERMTLPFDFEED